MKKKTRKRKRERLAFPPPRWRWSYLLLHPWEILGYYYREFKWFVQRGLYGYSTCDLWSLDEYLISFLPTAIRELRDTSMGRPCNTTPKEWKKTLTKIANGLESGKKMWRIVDEKRPTKAQKEFDEAMRLFHKWFWHLWD